MAKIKLTKNELKKQKDALKMFTRYLPTLILKKQQLQMEIRKVEDREAGVRRRVEDGVAAVVEAEILERQQGHGGPVERKELSPSTR